MNYTSQTVMVVAPPIPPPPPVVRDTRIRIRVDDPESLTWGMNYLTLAEGRERAVIDWGDGITTEVTANGAQEHAYARPGEYEARISDDISELRCSIKVGTSPYRVKYAPMIEAFRTDAGLLATVGGNCLYNAVNLVDFSIEGSGVRNLGARAMNYCTGLGESVDLPGVVEVAGDAFQNSPNITALHFSKANEETIRALAGYATRFGAANAEILFDL